MPAPIASPQAAAEQVWLALSALWPEGQGQSPLSVEWRPEIDSTNSELLRRARAGDHAALVLGADVQTAGRGRQGRQWHGQVGAALTFSIGVPLQQPRWDGLSLVAGVALAEALHPGVQLKWPNDLYWQGRKLGGILIEAASASPQMSYLVVGVGINVQAPMTQDDALRTPAAACCEIDPSASVPLLFTRLVPPLFAALLQAGREGFAPWRTRFAARDALANRAVTLSDGHQGWARGVNEQGALLLQGDDGRLRPIVSGEVSVRLA